LNLLEIDVAFHEEVMVNEEAEFILSSGN